MKIKFLFTIALFPAVLSYAQMNLEDQFGLFLEFGAPLEVVQLFQPFRGYKTETNGTISYITSQNETLLSGKPYPEYQIWYVIDRNEGLYQSSLILRGERTVLLGILTSYLRKFSGLYGEPVYTHLNNGSLLAFWYNESDYTVKARIVLDIDNPYKFISLTHCSPLPRHKNLLKSLYNENYENSRTAESTP